MPLQTRRAAPTGTGFVAALRRYIGVPYEWGGASPSGFDCSGLVEYTLTRLGVSGVPRTSEEQWAWVTKVNYRSVQAGDLVFMNFPGETSPGHVMVASRPGYVIQAPAPGQAVQEVPFRPLAPGASEWGGTIVGYGRVPGLAYPRDRGGPRARPPRPGNPNSPGGMPDPAAEAAAAADGSASDAWTRYADELTATPTASSSGFASLHFFGIPIPGTGWVPSWLDPMGSLGVPDLGSWNPLSVFGDAAGAVSDVGSFLHWIAWIFHPRNVLRIVEFLAGAALILVGLGFTRAGSATVGTAAAATPWGREAKGAKAALGLGGARRASRSSSSAAGRTRVKTKTVFVTDPDDPAARRDRLRRAAARAKPSDDIPF